MTWTTPADVAVEHIVTAAEWNQHNGTTGNLEHLHSGRNLVLERLTWVSGSVWQTSVNFLSGKWILLLWNNVPIPTMPVTGGTAWFTETAANRITFSSVMKTALTGGADTSSGDLVFAVYLKSE